jgi:hypothetical protein
LTTGDFGQFSAPALPVGEYFEGLRQRDEPLLVERRF